MEGLLSARVDRMCICLKERESLSAVDNMPVRTSDSEAINPTTPLNLYRSHSVRNCRDW